MVWWQARVFLSRAESGVSCFEFRAIRHQISRRIRHVILVHTLWCNSYPRKPETHTHTTNTLQKSNYINDAYQSSPQRQHKKKESNHVKWQGLCVFVCEDRIHATQNNDAAILWKQHEKKNYIPKNYARTDVCNMSVSCSVHTDYHLTSNVIYISSTWK